MLAPTASCPPSDREAMGGGTPPHLGQTLSPRPELTQHPHHPGWMCLHFPELPQPPGLRYPCRLEVMPTFPCPLRTLRPQLAADESPARPVRPPARQATPARGAETSIHRPEQRGRPSLGVSGDDDGVDIVGQTFKLFRCQPKERNRSRHTVPAGVALTIDL